MPPTADKTTTEELLISESLELNGEVSKYILNQKEANVAKSFSPEP